MNTLALLVASAIAIAATIRAVTGANAVHALLWLVVSLFGIAVDAFLLGAPFAAVLVVLVQAGAIVILFLFAVMLLGLDEDAVRRERRWLRRGPWAGPALLSGILAAELAWVLASEPELAAAGLAPAVGPRAVGAALLGPYLFGFEIVSMMLLAALVAAHHLGRRLPGRKETP